MKTKFTVTTAPWLVLGMVLAALILLVLLVGVLLVTPATVVRAAQPYVILDPGHGGDDSGAPRTDVAQICGVPLDLKEKDRTLDIALRVRDILQVNGVRVGMTRITDTNPTLNDRTNYINREQPNLAVSIHTNSAETCGDGVEAWYSSIGPGSQANPHTQASRQLAQRLAFKINQALGLRLRRNGGIEDARGNLHMVREPAVPSALVEMAFISNQTEALLLRDRPGDFAQAIAQAILEQLGEMVPPPTTSTATMLVLDISGSMDDSHQGRRKIDAAKDAATNILNMIEQESQAGQVSHQVAIVTFSTNAWLNLPLTNDYAQAKDIVAGIGPTNNTNIGAGLSVANQALQSAPTGSQKIVILLSDGLTNEGLPPAEILSGPVQEAANAGTCIYTVGFGDPGDLDEDLLRRIAEATGCKYYYAPDAYQLENIYIKVRHESLGNVIGEFSGQVSQGDTATMGQVEVPPNQGELYVTLNWPGSTLDLILTDPKGRRVDENYPGVTISTYAKMVYAILTNPIPGIWQATVFGRDVPEGIIDYNAVFSTRERVAQPTDYGPLLLVVVLMLGLAAVFLIITQTTRRPAYGVRVIQGYGPGGFAGFRRRVITIGRDPRSELVLWDNKVSHYHAQIRLERGWPIIYDLNSMNGTFVNGQRVTTQMLREGDRIRVGDTELVFQSQRAPSYHQTTAGQAELVVQAGAIPGMRYPLSKPVTTMGRNPQNDVALPGDVQVSSRHAEIRQEAGRFIIYDLGSTNGTFISGQQITKQVLRDGDEIRVGDTRLVFQGRQ